MKIGQLINFAIGFPEPGHVNFSALRFLLNCIVEKLGMEDEVVDYYNNETDRESTNYEMLKKLRIAGGSNPYEKNSGETPSELGAITLQKSHSANEITENEVEIVTSEKLIASESKAKHEDEKVLQQRNIDVVLSPRSSISPQLSAEKLKERITKIEMTLQDFEIPKKISSGISVMKDQLEFVIEQMLLLTFLTLSKKPDFKQINQLYAMAQTLLEIKKDNVYVEGFKQIELPTAPPLNWQSSDLQLNHDLAENIILETRSIGSEHGAAELQVIDHDDLADHLCYSPSKLLDQLMELKSDYCLLTNKINEISSRLLQQENQRTFALIQETQEQMREVKLTIANFKENQSRMELLLTGHQGNIEHIKGSIEEILNEKVDKTQFELQLANKVDYNQIQRMVSLDQILELQCRIDKKFREMLREIKENDEKFSQTVENLKNTLGFSAIDEVLKKFKENITKDIQTISELLKNYMEMTNDDCAAAGSRTKVLHHLACLSCDSNCVTRTVEKAKVAKLPGAHASNIISPLITYELSSIRKSGVMGYYRKDEFPHATNAWLAHQSNAVTNIKQSVPRHAGGQHTTTNDKTHTQKRQ